jgi:hypothetical protein
MAIDDGPRGTADGGGHRPPLQLTGMDDDLLRDVEQRVSEFEELHEPDVLRDGAGWVPRIQPRDYAIAIAVNAVIVVWLVIVLTRG